MNGSSRAGTAARLPEAEGVEDQGRKGERSWRENPLLVMLLLSVVTAIALTPVFLVTHPLQVDMPNHLARHYIAANLESSPYLSQLYDFEWKAIPYLAGDVFYLLFGQIFPGYDFARFIILFASALWLGTAFLLYRVLWGSYSCWPLLTVFLFYNANVGWGFESYLIGSALALCLFAVWVAWRGKAVAWKVMPFIPLATLLYFMHLFAFALFAVLLLTYEVGRTFKALRALSFPAVRDLGLVGLAMLPGTVHFLGSILTSFGTLDTGTGFGGLVSRAQLIRAPFSANYYDPSAIEVLTVAVLALVFYYGLRNGHLKFHRELKPVVLVIGVLALAMPWLLSGVAYAHYRLPFLFILLLLAGTKWRNIPQARYWSAVSLLVALLALRSFGLASDWQEHDGEVKELVESFQLLDPGARLLPVTNDKRPDHWHSPSLAVIERDAFVPTGFSGATLLSVSPGLAEISLPAGGHFGVQVLKEAMAAAEQGRSFLSGDPAVVGSYKPGVVARNWWRDFTHVLIIDHKGTVNPFPGVLEVLYEGSFFTLYRNLMFGVDVEGLVVKEEGRLARSPAKRM